MSNLSKFGIVLIITFGYLGNSKLVAKDGLEILKEVESHMEAHSFVATCDWQGGQIDKVVQKTASNGVIEVRSDFIIRMGGFSVTNTYITNQKGVWRILEDKALKIDSTMKFNTNSVFYGMLENRVDLSTPSSFEVEVGRFNKKDVFIVDQKLRVADDGKKRTSFIAVENKYFVGKEDFFLYGFSQKTLDGNVAIMTVLESNVWQEIPDTFFELPAGVVAQVMTNRSEYVYEMNKYLNKIVQDPKLVIAYRSSIQGKRHFIWFFLTFPTLFIVGWVVVKLVLVKRKGLECDWK